MKFSDSTERITRRNWEDIINQWIDIIPQINFPVQTDLENETINAELEECFDQISIIESSSTLRNHYFAIKGMHSLIFHESLLLLYKGLNAIKSAHVSMENGYTSWATENFYQSSYFFLKCFIGLLGVGSFRTATNKDMLIDLFPRYVSSSKKEFQRRQLEKQIQILQSSQPSHYELWTLFKRILSISAELPVSDNAQRIFRKIESKDFARHRNRLIYHNRSWLYDDLKNELVDLNCHNIEFTLDSLETYSSCTLLSYFLLKTIISLIESIAHQSESFNIEYNIIIDSLNSKSNNPYLNYISEHTF